MGRWGSPTASPTVGGSRGQLGLTLPSDEIGESHPDGVGQPVAAAERVGHQDRRPIRIAAAAGEVLHVVGLSGPTPNQDQTASLGKKSATPVSPRRLTACCLSSRGTGC